MKTTTRPWLLGATLLVALGGSDPALAKRIAPAPPPPPVVLTLAPYATAPPTLDKAGLKRVKAARKAKGAKAVEAWTKVQALDADHSEARYGLAAAYLALKWTDDALVELRTLVASPRTDAIEFLVQARTAKAFRAWAKDPAFQVVVGIGVRPTVPYDLLVGRGLTWRTPKKDEWDGPGSAYKDVFLSKLAFKLDRTFALKAEMAGDSDTFKVTGKGTWRTTTAGVELTFTGGDVVDKGAVASCVFKEVSDGKHAYDDGLRCEVAGKDPDDGPAVFFVAVPTSVPNKGA